MRNWSTLKKLIWLRKAACGRGGSFRRISSSEEPVSRSQTSTACQSTGRSGEKKAIDRVLSDESPDLKGMHDHE